MSINWIEAIDACSNAALASGALASGALTLRLPTGYDYATGTAALGAVALNLAPDGRERVVEGGWSAPLGPRARLMCSFTTTPAEIDEFLADCD